MNQEQLKEYGRLNAELMVQERIAHDVEGQQSDDVIRARKEVQRIKFDIVALLEKKA
jgi:hypothetical protein